MPARLQGAVQGKDDFMNISDAIRSIIKPHTDEILAPLSTVFSESMDREKPWQEYPRPQFVRDSYFSLNGLWDYAITGDRMLPSSFDGQILVPFSPECSLSGVSRNLQPGEYLYYHRLLPEDFCRIPSGYRLLLHFGAVDYETDIILNHKQVLHHIGGYLPFTADITDFLCEGENHLSVRVRDDTNRTEQSRGKQSLERGGIFYTAQSGIWQSVWLEQVPSSYIKDLYFLPSFDTGEVTVTATIAGSVPSSAPVLTVSSGDTELLSTTLHPQKDSVHNHDSREKEQPLSLSVSSMAEPGTLSVYTAVFSLPEKDFHPWTPENPFLYDAKLSCATDQVTSYFAMRLYSIEQKAPGNTPVFCLNHTPCFLMGALDQGYWPEGLYTAPSDEALVYDIQTTKSLGYNMLRKHIKVEMARWYYHCDRLGMIVCQDMVNGGGSYSMPLVSYLPTVSQTLCNQVRDHHYSLLSREDKTHRERFELECRSTVEYLKFFPSIAIYCPFNEGWGQFDAVRITDMIRKLDPTRLIDSTSGWFDQGCGDFVSVHNYFRKLSVPAEHFSGKRLKTCACPAGRARFLSEYGGLACQIKDHSSVDRVFGYKHYDTLPQFQEAYRELIQDALLPLKEKGLSGAVYTQVSDVEEEVNGLMTYDRKVIKLPFPINPKQGL